MFPSLISRIHIAWEACLCQMPRAERFVDDGANYENVIKMEAIWAKVINVLLFHPLVFLVYYCGGRRGGGGRRILRDCFFFRALMKNALQIRNCKMSAAHLQGDALGSGRPEIYSEEIAIITESNYLLSRLRAVPVKASFGRLVACSEIFFSYHFCLVGRQHRRTRFAVHPREEGFSEGFLFYERLKDLARKQRPPPPSPPAPSPHTLQDWGPACLCFHIFYVDTVLELF